MRNVSLLLVWLLVIAAVVVGGVRFYVGRDDEVRAWTGDFVDFDHTPRKGSDHFLSCPPDTCNGNADMVSPVFPVSVDRLHNVWIQTMARDPRLRLIRQDHDGLYLGYVQRSAVFGLPDIISVQFVSVGDSRSSIEIDSAARYPAVDFGGNRRRVEDWMKRMMQNFPEGGALSG